MSNDAPFSDETPGGSPQGDDVPYAWIDEWLCEYVDGTMDPALEAVFTSYVEANPDLKSHVEELQQTRELLGQCRFSDPPSADQACTDVRDHVESDLLRSRLSMQEALGGHPQFATGLIFSMLTALVVGLVVGATVVSTPNSASYESTAVEKTELPASPTLAADRPALPLLAPGAQSERSSRAAATASAIGADSWQLPTLALDTLQNRSPLTLIRTQR